MRLTPAQHAMHALLGRQFPMGMFRESSLAELIRRGHELLVRISKIDHGYDPAAWHEHLRATDDGGYRWSNKHLGFPRRIATALADPAWHRAVALLLADILDPRWRTGDVVALARGIVVDRAFDRLPILADALQDAGCGDEQILSHCRQSKPNRVDSWVIRLLLDTGEDTDEPGATPDRDDIA